MGWNGTEGRARANPTEQKTSRSRYALADDAGAAPFRQWHLRPFLSPLSGSDVLT